MIPCKCTVFPWTLEARCILGICPKSRRTANLDCPSKKAIVIWISNIMIIWPFLDSRSSMRTWISKFSYIHGSMEPLRKSSRSNYLRVCWYREATPEIHLHINSFIQIVGTFWGRMAKVLHRDWQCKAYNNGLHLNFILCGWQEEFLWN